MVPLGLPVQGTFRRRCSTSGQGSNSAPDLEWPLGYRQAGLQQGGLYLVWWAAVLLTHLSVNLSPGSPVLEPLHDSLTDIDFTPSVSKWLVEASHTPLSLVTDTA
eukprot:360444-Chlamydomonas_euryale.AAC.2